MEVFETRTGDGIKRKSCELLNSYHVPGLLLTLHLH